MTLPDIVSREEWTRARVALLEQEKALTKARDALAAERRRLPMVEVTEDYGFTAADGSTKTLLDLFEGRHQLIVDHYMFDPDWEDGCMSCAARVDQFGNIAHLHERDTTIAVVSRARSASEWEARGMPAPQGELHGTSVFLRDGAAASSTPTRPTAAAPSRSAAPTTTST